MLKTTTYGVGNQGPDLHWARHKNYGGGAKPINDICLTLCV